MISPISAVDNIILSKGGNRISNEKKVKSSLLKMELFSARFNADNLDSNLSIYHTG